ncbi:hypothetical protein [Marinibactrum halimedae]|uniref:Uncharacterized protein n=1 Tax=Marinibactrum halimedae TaxID=1444977 RepID=A0AA37WR21_9GAMM|nr:hypothetical protein [Marinibactrum halimedae]MCD9460544.1 hypothetical protein [Marinibactrum halimedae]GLS27907.1 hypothetical protein GCM10007877_36260 [Marinibactrum halimedae]
MQWVLTALLTVIIFGSVLWLLLHVRTPRYHVIGKDIERILELVITGQATENDWSVFTAYQIRDNDYLESIRERCMEIEEREYIGDVRPPYLFTSNGIEEIRALHDELKNYHQRHARS